MPERTIYYDVSTVDARIEMRGELAVLRQIPGVSSVGLLGVNHETRVSTYVVSYREEAWGGQLTSIVEDRGVPPRFLTTHSIQVSEPPPVEDTREGWRRRFAQSMTEPLRRTIDYQSVGRRALLVEQLPEGALPVYDRNPDVASIVLDPDAAPNPSGNRPLTVETLRDVMESLQRQDLRPSRIFMNHADYQDLVAHAAHRVTIPQFEIASNLTINISEVRSRRFDLIDRKPSEPWPDWVKVGMWVDSELDAMDMGTIERVGDWTIEIRPWRGVDRTIEVSRMDLGWYKPCAPPPPVPSRYERAEVV